MSISISRTCYFENKCPQTRMNTGLADSFAKYDALRNFFMEKDAPRRPFVVFRVGLIGRQIVVARICIGFKAA